MSIAKVTEQPQLLVTDGVFGLATWGPVFIALWRGEPSVERSLQLERMIERTLGSRVHFLLQIIEETSPVPNAEVRTISARITRNFVGRVTAAAHVVEGDNFRAQVVRTVLRGMTLLVRNTLPQKYCANDAEAVAWLAQYIAPKDAESRESFRAGLASAATWLRAKVNATSRT